MESSPGALKPKTQAHAGAPQTPCDEWWDFETDDDVVSTVTAPIVIGLPDESLTSGVATPQPDPSFELSL
jgi:hypothetical protein